MLFRNTWLAPGHSCWLAAGYVLVGCYLCVVYVLGSSWPSSGERLGCCSYPLLKSWIAPGQTLANASSFSSNLKASCCSSSSRKYHERSAEPERSPGAVAKFELLSRMLDWTGAVFRATHISGIWESCQSFVIAPGRCPESNITNISRTFHDFSVERTTLSKNCLAIEAPSPISSTLLVVALDKISWRASTRCCNIKAHGIIIWCKYETARRLAPIL